MSRVTGLNSHAGAPLVSTGCTRVQPFPVYTRPMAVAQEGGSFASLFGKAVEMGTKYGKPLATGVNAVLPIVNAATDIATKGIKANNERLNAPVVKGKGVAEEAPKTGSGQIAELLAKAKKSRV